MAENNNAETFERFGIDRIYDTSQAVANKLRRMAEDIESEIQRARENEANANLTRSMSYMGLPAEVTNIVVTGLGNARLDSPARQLRELMLAREAQRVLDDRKAEAYDRIAEHAANGKCPECYGEKGRHKMDCSFGRTLRAAARFTEDGQ